MKRISKLSAGAGGVALLGSLALATSALGTSASPVRLHSDLDNLNNSGASGHASVVFRGERAHVQIDAHGLLAKMPHAQHIHFGAQARHECPNVAQDDRNNDHRLNTTDGAPGYGPIRKSLTTRGGTGPGSALAVDRFPSTPRGNEHYDRTITVNSNAVARAIKHGKGVLVIHGVDYNGNGKYDFRGAGKSDLDPNLPAEATDPAVCGVIR